MRKLTMTRRAVFLAAMCAGLLAAFMVYLLLERQKARAAELTEPVHVVVAKQDIPPRTIIQSDMVEPAVRPIGTLPKNTASYPQEVVGKVTLRALPAGQPIQRPYLAARSAALGLAYVVPISMRAVTVALDPIIGVAGFVRAGDRVDVLATFQADKVSVTKTVLQNVELLAVGPDVRPSEVRRTAGDPQGPRERPNATLSVTPSQAEKLILSESRGKLRLTLRPVDEDSLVPLSGITTTQLIGIAPQTGTPTSPKQDERRVMPAGYASPAFSASAPSFRPFAGLLPPVSPAIQSDGGARASGHVVEVVRGCEKSAVAVRE
jgi:pilus assembly protein CpaB